MRMRNKAFPEGKSHVLFIFSLFISTMYLELILISSCRNMLRWWGHSTCRGLRATQECVPSVEAPLPGLWTCLSHCCSLLLFVPFPRHCCSLLLFIPFPHLLSPYSLLFLPHGLDCCFLSVRACVPLNYLSLVLLPSSPLLSCSIIFLVMKTFYDSFSLCLEALEPYTLCPLRVSHVQMPC